MLNSAGFAAAIAVHHRDQFVGFDGSKLEKLAFAFHKARIRIAQKARPSSRLARESHGSRRGHRRVTSTRAGPDADDGPAEPPAHWPACPSCGRRFPWQSTLERCALLGCRRWIDERAEGVR